MRNAFAQEIYRLAEIDSKVVLLSGDIGNRMFDKFKAAFPERFYNCGVAEANMISMAAGLAMTGMRPYVYTIASFLVYRPFEQIRVDIGYHQLPVVLIGVGGGLSYASNGPTHHAVEDIAAVRSIPEINIVSPGDANEVKAVMRSIHASEHPTYLRIGKKNEPLVFDDIRHPCTLGAAVKFSENQKQRVSILTHGNILSAAKEVFETLNGESISAGLVHFPFLRPFDYDQLKQVCEDSDTVISLEEHSVTGGLGTIVAEWIAEHPEATKGTRLLRLGTEDKFLKRTTNQKDAREHLGLDVPSILNSIKALLNERGN